MTPDDTRQPDSPQSANTGRRRRRSVTHRLGFWVCVLFGVLAGSALMPRPDRVENNLRNVSEDGQLNRIRRFLHGGPTAPRASEIGKNHELVKAAFRDVVRQARQSTVEVKVDGRRVALGTVMDRDGHILTKASELDGTLTCQIGRGDEFSAEIVGVDRELDLALLRTSKKDLTPVVLANEVPPVGSWLAVPDSRGEIPLLVGVTSTILREIPRANGFLGVLLGQASRGSRIDHVLPESSAERFGLRSGDVIYSVNGRRVHNRFTLIETVQEFQPGTDVEFGLMRGDKKITRRIMLTRREEVAAAEDGSQQHDGGPLSNRRSGFSQVLQHDCPLRPNDCGGPLVNLDGQAVGINIARAGRVESYAVPASLVRTSFVRLKANRN
jgi:serine protease Do